MEKIVLYCKSYKNDVYRVKSLLDSITLYNRDSIPFFISTPKEDLELFSNILGDNLYTLIPDEDIDSTNQGWLGQQVVKSQFWKLQLCENYVCIDSDSVFIKPFYVKDFMYNDNTPYTICHEHRELFEFMDKHQPGFDPYKEYKNDRLSIMEFFQRDGVIYDFGPSPVIWSASVWKSLYEKYLQPNNLNFTDLFKTTPSEFTWYGEWLLHDNTIPIYPRGPLFKVYHYSSQYEYDKHYKLDNDKLSKYYLGVILQSNWSTNIIY
jgi:hypothetical protein